VVQVQALAGDIVLCSWERQFALTVPLSTQMYKWVLANLVLEATQRWISIISQGELNPSSCFMIQKPKISPGLIGHLAHMQTYFGRVERQNYQDCTDLSM